MPMSPCFHFIIIYWPSLLPKHWPFLCWHLGQRVTWPWWQVPPRWIYRWTDKLASHFRLPYYPHVEPMLFCSHSHCCFCCSCHHCHCHLGLVLWPHDFIVPRLTPELIPAHLARPAGQLLSAHTASHAPRPEPACVCTAEQCFCSHVLHCLIRLYL